MNYGKISLWTLITSIILIILTTLDIGKILGITSLILSIILLLGSFTLSIISLIKYSTDKMQSKKTAIVILILSSLIILLLIYLSYLGATTHF